MQYVGKRSGHGGACHRSFLLSGSLDAVTSCARFRSDKIVSRSNVLSRPESWFGKMVLCRQLAKRNRNAEAHREKNTEESTTLPTPSACFIRFQTKEEPLDRAWRKHSQPSYRRLDSARRGRVSLSGLKAAASRIRSFPVESDLGAGPVDARTTSSGAMTISD